MTLIKFHPFIKRNISSFPQLLFYSHKLLLPEVLEDLDLDVDVLLTCLEGLRVLITQYK